MITFPQLLNLLTENKCYSWFVIPTSYLSAFSQEERAQWYEQMMNDNFTRVYWPKEGVLTGLDKQGLQRMLLQAAEKGDMEMVRLIKERMITIQ